MDRRQILTAGALTAAAITTGAAATPAAAHDTADPFLLGVASGDPRPTA